MPRWRIGTMGFSYGDWAGPFYPDGMKPADYLSFYARHFDAVELDTTFHATPPIQRVRNWVEMVPEDFRFAVKAPRAVTHDAPIGRALPELLRFLDAVRGFGVKLGVVLLQFPPSFSVENIKGVAGFLAGLPGDVRFAVEFRHRSWRSSAEMKDLLSARRCCLVAADYDDEVTEIVPTTDLLYLRFIGRHQRFSHLGREELDMTERLAWWLEKAQPHLGSVGDVWGMFNNDFSGFAVPTADRFRRLLGLRVPELRPPAQGELFG